MPIRIKLIDDQMLFIRADPDEWDRAYRSALENNTVIKVHEGERTLAINPRQILFWEERPEEEPAPRARQAQPA